MPLTKPIDTAQNTLLHRRQQQRIYSTVHSADKAGPNAEIMSYNARSGTTEANTMLDGRDLASITSGGNREEHFDFSQTL